MKFLLMNLLFVFSLFSYSLNAQMVIGDMKVGQGVSNPNAWVDYNLGAPTTDRGIFIDVNTSSCGFTNTPHYLVTLEGPSGYHWLVSGVPSIYSPTPTGFRIYLIWTNTATDDPAVGSLGFPNPLDAATAINRQWVIRWTGIELNDCASCDDSGSLPLNPRIDAFGGNETSERQIDNSSFAEELTETIIVPNPTNSKITIKSKVDITKCEIYNLSGKLMISEKYNIVDVSNLPSGNYYVKIYSNNNVETKQFVKFD